MKIAIVCDVLGKPNNGTSIAAYNLINFLKKQGHEVHVICPDEDKKDWENYHIVKRIHFGPLDNYVKKNGVILAKPDKKILEPIIKEMDIIHCLLPFPLGKKATRIAKKYNIPVTVSSHVQAENFTAHLFLMHFEPANFISYRVFNSNVYKHAVAIHYPSQFISDFCFHYGIKNPKPYVISNGVNPGIFPKTAEKPKKHQDKFVILYTARFSGEKNHKVLIKAIKYSKYADKIQLVFAGAGPKKPSLIKYAQKRKLVHQPEFSFFSREQMNDVVNSADLYVHASNIEIEAIACNEAVSCGLVPVISNSKKSAATQFALDERNLFKKNNAKDLAAKIDYWIENPELKAQQKAEYLVKRVPDSVEQAMQKMEQMIFDALEIHQKRQISANSQSKTANKK